jgi:hypothetical protein
MMHQSRHLASMVAVPLAAALIGLPAAALRAGSTQRPALTAQGQCAVVGTYRVGGPPYPVSSPGPQASPRSAWPGHGPGAAFTVLRGALVITAYRGCGAPTLGTFSVRRSIIGPLPNQPSNILVPLTGVQAASGTFAQDPTHAGDPLYVRVSATITTTRPAPMLGLMCPRKGCPTNRVITSTLTFAGVTGYLQAPSPPGQTAILSFLPPPAAGDGTAPSALVLAGTRRGLPLPAATGTAGGMGTAVVSTAVVGRSTAVAGGTPLPSPTAGPSATPVPAGATLVLRFPPNTATLTVHVGTTIVLESGPVYAIGDLRYDTAILASAGDSSDGSPVLHAIGPGSTQLSAVASPRCLNAHPACELPSLLLTYTIRVLP